MLTAEWELRTRTIYDRTYTHLNTSVCLKQFDFTSNSYVKCSRNNDLNKRLNDRRRSVGSASDS